MIGELVRTTTKDKLKLQGFLSLPKDPTKKVVLHIHGLEGNFYENEFIDYLAEAVNEKGFAFCSVNTRGAGVLTDFVSDQEGTKSYSSVGAARELVNDIILDLQAWIDFLNKRGFNYFILSGHSLGTIKVVYYQATKQNPKVKGIIILEPVDYVSFAEQAAGKNFSQYLKQAKKMINKGKGKELLPDNWHFLIKCSAQTYWDWFNKNSKARIFEFNNPMKPSPLLKKIKIPVLAIMGDKDKYIKNPKTALEYLHQQLKYCTPVLIKNADHWYNKTIRKLREEIKNWISSLSK